ncbi:MAG: hydrogenase expression/formation protein HypE [Elusimicrobia bacterium]|nr:hydrogenase expression/formation protein HypE [Elusimicrobiota bacterium]
MKDKYITREHGYGGGKTRELLEKVIIPNISNVYLDQLDDSAVLPPAEDGIIFTADSFVVKPVFFPGGDIGKLAVSGTVNDILAQGGEPLYLSMTVILEEGFPVDDLGKIAASAGKEAKEAGIKIVCGDIKVVEKGSGDGIYVSTSGIGRKMFDLDKNRAREGDAVIVTGPVAQHGAAIFQARSSLIEDSADIKSDCASLTRLTRIFGDHGKDIRFMRDPTRGGLAGVLLELSGELKKRIDIRESDIPVKEWVKGIAYLSGMDYLYLACEGRMVILASGEVSVKIMEDLAKYGFESPAVIGRIGSGSGVVMETASGGRRVLDISDIVQVPRIC